MRNPKFRIWNKVKKDWEVKDFHLIGEVMLLQGFPISMLNDLEVNQSTELKDRNDVEIYEGDVVTYYGDGGVNAQATKAVKWQTSTQSCGWNIANGSHRAVVGNIYENPELLK